MEQLSTEITQILTSDRSAEKEAFISAQYSGFCDLFNRETNPVASGMWCQALEDVPTRYLKMAFKRVLKGARFMPTPSEVLEAAASEMLKITTLQGRLGLMLLKKRDQVKNGSSGKRISGEKFDELKKVLGSISEKKPIDCGAYIQTTKGSKENKNG